ncbi:MAG TPA: SDR family NAD(P)-dependent oxidoreductase [Solirubrobacterales bacterium]|nr:SDR family NAD(P)-dependent oxidoreductase [Solirubrobacterales bacterium]
MSSNFGLQDQTVIITGGARGIGRATAGRFAEAGATVFIVDTDAEALEAAAREVGAIPRVADVTDTAQVEAVVAAAVAETGRIDVLFNNAGLLRDKMLWKLSDEDWDLVVDISLGGTFRFTRACVPHFRERNYGRVINVTSYTGLHGNIGQAAYGAAKAGVIGFTNTAAKELGRFGVTVNAISPNAMTRMVESIPEGHRQELETQIPLGRWGEPGEIAGTVLFLASPEAGYITGTVVRVDGGIAI